MGQLKNGSSPHTREIGEEHMPLIQQALLNLFETSTPEDIIQLRRSILGTKVLINRAYDDWATDAPSG